MYIYKYSRNEFSRRRGRYCKNNGPPTRNRENDHGGCDAHSARRKYLPESQIDQLNRFLCVTQQRSIMTRDVSRRIASPRSSSLA